MSDMHAHFAANCRQPRSDGLQLDTAYCQVCGPLGSPLSVIQADLDKLARIRELAEHHRKISPSPNMNVPLGDLEKILYD